MSELARCREAEAEKKKARTHPKGEGSAVFGELEADEAVYEEARICGGYQSGIYCGEPGINDVRGGYNSRIEEDGEEFDEGIEPEESYNLLAAYRRH
jgi:hypothetical protein